MKTTIETRDELLACAKRLASATGPPLRALVEDGLRLVCGATTPAHSYSLRDVRRGNADAPDPFAGYSWPELRELIYGDPGSR